MANNFDFKQYNDVMKAAGAGLKLMLIEQLLEDVEKTTRRFNNPLKEDVSDILDEVYALRAAWKKQAETREKVSEVAAQVDTRLAA
jgi:hypothetical protein